MGVLRALNKSSTSKLSYRLAQSKGIAEGRQQPPERQVPHLSTACHFHRHTQMTADCGCESRFEALVYFIQNKIVTVMCIVKDDLLIDSKRNME